MIFRFVLLAVCAAIVAHGELPQLDIEEMAAVQERLANYDMLEEIVRSYLRPEEKRAEEKCIPEGGECTFGSGPNCCGISTRCIIWDTQLPAKRRGGSATWVSKCRKYKGGVAAEAIINFFKNLG